MNWQCVRKDYKEKNRNLISYVRPSAITHAEESADLGLNVVRARSAVAEHDLKRWPTGEQADFLDLFSFSF